MSHILTKIIVVAVIFFLPNVSYVSVAIAQEAKFLSSSEGKLRLSQKDDFIIALSPFDRSARLKTDKSVTEKQFLDFIGASARDWSTLEKSKVQAAFDYVIKKAMLVGVPVPPTVEFVKTSGKEEGNAAYTRGKYIVLPQGNLSADEFELRRQIAHEIFHLVSRSNSALKTELYRTIGFLPCSPALLPTELAPRKITNPDAPANDFCITVTVGGKQRKVTPMLISDAVKYDPVRGGEFFEYLQLGFLLRTDSQPDVEVAGLQDLRGFFEQIGTNTQYIIHPEEILADNFAFLVLGTEVKTPAILDKMRATFTKH